jgi:hypothetical protein
VRIKPRDRLQAHRSKEAGYDQDRHRIDRLEGEAMSAAEALKAARTAGVKVGLDGDDLLLEASIRAICSSGSFQRKRLDSAPGGSRL